MKEAGTKNKEYFLKAIKKNRTVPNAGKDMEQLNSHTLLVGMQNCTSTLENSLAVFYKVKHELTIKLHKAIPRYLPRRNETHAHTKTHIGMFIADLFIIVKTWK